MASISPPKDVSSVKLPERIGKYLITRLLGEGGMGRVYRGIDPDTNRVVAVKTILAERMASPTSLPRFMREMQILAGLDNPHIVKILDRGLAGEEHFLVMDYVEGRPLDDVIRKGPLPPRTEGLSIARKIAEALAYMHSQGVMHRDLKPANIILGEGGKVTIIDFGLSRFLDRGGTVTGQGRVIGSPHYLPPEQWRGERPDHRADVYQLGILLIEILTGKVPFSGSDLRAIMESCLHFGVSEALLESIGLTGEANELVRRCTARRLEDRYQEMAVLLEDLRRLERGEKLAEMPDSPTALHSFSLDLTADSLTDVDPDAPTARENRSFEPKAAASFHPPGKASGPRPPPPAAQPRGGPPGPAGGQGAPLPDRGLKPPDQLRPLGSRPMVQARVEPGPGIPPATIFSILLVFVLSAALFTLATRPPPPKPVPRVVVGPKVSDGVAAARVEWETDLPTESVVEVRGAGALREVRGDDGVRRDHQVLLQELRPGSPYTVRVLGPQGPMGDAVTFSARGVSIAFDPVFTRRGIELHWRSEDALRIEAEGTGAGSAGAYPSKQGLVFLPGVRPGAGGITVIAIPPLGAPLSVAWTVPALPVFVERLEKALDELLGADAKAPIEAALAVRDGPRAAALLAARAERAAGGLSSAQLFAQVGLALDATGLQPEVRIGLARQLGELRLLERRIQLLAPQEDPLPLEEAFGSRFRWGARAGVPLKAKSLAEWRPPPAPLLATSGPEPPAGGSPPHALTWKLPAGLRAGSTSVTLVVHCIQLAPALYLEAHLDGRLGMALLSTPEVFKLEGLDAEEAWTMVFHGFDPELLRPAGSVLVIRARAVASELDGRAVAVTRLELLDGPLED